MNDLDKDGYFLIRNFKNVKKNLLNNSFCAQNKPNWNEEIIMVTGTNFKLSCEGCENKKRFSYISATFNAKWK